MANEIVKMVAEKAHISESVAEVAVDTVLKFLKTKLPASVGGVLDSVVGSGGSASKTGSAKKSDSPLGGLGDIAGTLGGLFGGKKK